MVTRACYFLECAHFVHQCNRGQWPTWLKMNLPVFRPSKGNNLNAQPMVQRRTQILQLQATKMFYQWAEVSQSVLIKYSVYTLSNSEGVIVVMTCSLGYLPTVRKNVRSAHLISETFQLSSIHASLQSMIPSFREFGLRSLAQHWFTQQLRIHIMLYLPISLSQRFKILALLCDVRKCLKESQGRRATKKGGRKSKKKRRRKSSTSTTVAVGKREKKEAR